MTRDEIFERLRMSLCDLFDFPEEKVDWKTNLIDDLDLDSIDIFDLLSKLEDTVELELLPEEFRDCRTVEQVVDRLVQLLDGETGKSQIENRTAS